MISVAIEFLLIAVMAVHSDAHSNDHLVGGYVDRDVNSTEIQNFAQKAVEQFNAESNDTKLYVLVQIVDAKSHVVNGVHYKINVILGKTNCDKGSACSDNEPVTSTENYVVKAFSQPWNQRESVSIEKSAAPSPSPPSNRSDF